MSVTLHAQQELASNPDADQIGSTIRSMLAQMVTDAEQMGINLDWGTTNLNVGTEIYYGGSNNIANGRPLQVSIHVKGARVR